MNASSCTRRVAAVFIFLLLLSSINTRAGGALYFFTTKDAHGDPNYSWFSAANWYVPSGNTFAPANRIPQDDDDAFLMTSPVECEANNIEVHSLTVEGVTVVGGDFTVINIGRAKRRERV